MQTSKNFASIITKIKHKLSTDLPYQLSSPTRKSEQQKPINQIAMCSPLARDRNKSIGRAARKSQSKYVTVEEEPVDYSV
jgi:hypothetical protein